MADQPDQNQPGTTLAFQEALTQAIELWDNTPVSILDQQVVQTHALLLAMGKYITYRKEKKELESCADGTDFINRHVFFRLIRTETGCMEGTSSRRNSYLPTAGFVRSFPQ
ncbi:MAG: hypothetical protein WBZ19_24620 [Chthoniobacterales bacterium]